jgi:hypothetical protein
MLNRHNIGCNIIQIICIATDNDRDGPAENNYQIKIYILYMPRDLYRMRERPIITLYSIVCVRAQWAIISEQRVIYAHTTFNFFLQQYYLRLSRNNTVLDRYGKSGLLLVLWLYNVRVLIIIIKKHLYYIYCSACNIMSFYVLQYNR